MKIENILKIITSLFLISTLHAQTIQQKELLEQVKTHYDIQEISPRHQQGFTYQFALLEMYDQLAPDLQKVADSYIYAVRPQAQEVYISPSGKFSLHFNTTGPDAVDLEDLLGNGIPDYIDSAAAFLDYSWEVEINQLGFQPPLDINGDPVESYDIYFRQLPFGNYGITWFDDEIESLPGMNYTSYIELDSDFIGNGLYTFGLDAMRVTCAHEFNHAIQLSYRFWSSDTYFFEMTSTWLEEFVYPDVNDFHQYLPGLFTGIQETALTSANYPYDYGNGIYLQMLAKQYDPDIVVDIWQRIRSENALDALETILKRNNSSLRRSINDYGKWMYFTGDRTIDGAFFDDAADFPEMNVKPNLRITGNSNLFHDFSARGLTFTYLAVDSITILKNLAQVFVEQSGWMMLNFFTDDEQGSIAVEENSPLFVWLKTVPKDVLFVVSNAGAASADVSFSLTEDDGSDAEDVKFGPNPVVHGDNFYFRNLPLLSKVYILDLSQRVVRKLEYNTIGNPYLPWDLKDNNGKDVASGIYYFVAKSDGRTQTGKIAVVR